MAKIQSIFGGYAEQLQAVVNNSLSIFTPTWYQRYFSWSPTQTQLTFVSVIGASRIEAAASIVDRSSGAPLRSRAQLAKYQGEIPAIKEKFAMTEQDYRDFLTVQAVSLSDAGKKQQLLDLLFADVQKAGASAHKRLDIMALQAVSTGKISLTAEWNPDGIILKDDLDLLMPSANKKQAAVKWATTATSTPITDITTLVNNASLLGHSFAKNFNVAVGFLEFGSQQRGYRFFDFSFNQLQKGAQVATITKINEYMTANLLPEIEIVNEVVGIEKDGIIGTVRPFADKNVSFIPAGNLGTIKNAFCIEEMRPVSGINYASYNRALISKWQENDPWGEYTAVELNAFPAVDVIDRMYLLEIEF